MASVKVFLSVRYEDGQQLPDLGSAITRAIKRVTGKYTLINDVVSPPDALAQALRSVDVLVAEITSRSPRVMWEVGVASGVGIPVVLISQDPGAVPVELRRQQILMYSANAPLAHLQSRLEDALQRILVDNGELPNRPSLPPVKKLFLSYCHEDAEYLDRILVHLRPLERRGLIDSWSDSRLEPGDIWRDEISKALAAAKVAVLLVSADFLASEFITSRELPGLLESAESRGTRIIPVILKPSRFARELALSKFQAINSPDHPVIGMNEAERENLYAGLAESVERDIPMCGHGA